MQLAAGTVLGLLTIVMLTGRARASCAALEIDEAFHDARAVLVGKVLSTRIVHSTSDPFGTRTVATIDVEQQWKGPGRKTIELSTCGGEDVVCTVSMEFVVGDRYLFFAYDDVLETSDCSAWPIDKAEPELRWLAQKDSSRPG